MSRAVRNRIMTAQIRARASLCKYKTLAMNMCTRVAVSTHYIEWGMQNGTNY